MIRPVQPPADHHRLARQAQREGPHDIIVSRRPMQIPTPGAPAPPASRRRPAPGHRRGGPPAGPAPPAAPAAATRSRRRGRRQPTAGQAEGAR
jgi:hypothetical protein